VYTPVPIGPFPGGLNLIDASPGELSYCQNTRLNLQGWPQARPGHGGYGSSPAKVNGDFLVNFLKRFYYGSNKLLIAASAGKLFKGNDTTGAWTQIDIDGVAGNSMEATLLAGSVVYKDRLYNTDGTKPQRYNGTDNVFAGHYIPVSSGWTLTGGTGGSPCRGCGGPGPCPRSAMSSARTARPRPP